MGYRDLLQKEDERLVSPWIGGRSLHSGSRQWHIDGPLPKEHGWYTFVLLGRKARLGDDFDAAMAERPFELPPGSLQDEVQGYLVGDRIVLDGARVDPDPLNIVKYSERVYLIDPGLDRFARIEAGRTHEDGPLVFAGQEMPLGPEDEVLNTYLDQKTSVSDIKNVSPALDAAFQMETWQRAEAERRRIELERLRQEEEERKIQEERRRGIAERLGTGAGRRAMAQIDFREAAQAALAVGGAEYLDHRASTRRGETVVRFRFINRRFECVCDQNLHIVDAGICLTSHDTGKKYDEYFTLESLPSVIQEAEDEGKLVVFRHVG
jgi:hypothetical protein